jgi:hypothetical protein
MDAVDLAFFMLVLQLTKVQLEELELDLLMGLSSVEEFLLAKPPTTPHSTSSLLAAMWS